MGLFTSKKKKSVPLKEHRRITSALRDEIRRKDAIIQELRQKNEFVVGASLKQAQRNDDILDMVKKLKQQLKEVEEAQLNQ